MSGGTLFFLLLFGGLGLYLVALASGRRWPDPAARLLTLLAWLALTVGLIARGRQAGHWPLSDRFEFALCFVWAVLLVHLLVEWRSATGPALGLFVTALALTLAIWAYRRPGVEQAVRPLAPALRSGWLQLHVGFSALAYGALGVGAGLGCLALACRRWPQETARWPPVERLDAALYQVVAWGFLALSAGMLTGAVWAQAAWGRYWDWDPKESWTLIVWLTYLTLLHGRTLRGWRGRRTAWLAIFGFGAVLFTFWGLSWLVRTVQLESLHVF